MGALTHGLESKVNSVGEKNWKVKVLICLEVAGSAEKRKDFDEAMGMAKQYLREVFDQDFKNQIRDKIQWMIDKRCELICSSGQFGTSLGIKLRKAI